jgi:3-dehydroquinate synthase
VAEATRVTVGGEAPYDVVVGRGLEHELPALVGPGARRVALAHAASRSADVQRWAAVLSDAGHDVLPLALPEAEAAKTAEVAAGCWSALGRAGFTRSDAVVAVGGGATTDLAGFVAATWLRGVRLVHVPTTLLGMVDAAVGGKTGINTTEGKNLVGAFHAPAGVLCDLDSLSSLPAPDLAAGLAEVVKVGFTSDPRILDIIESSPSGALDVAGPQLRELVERAVAVKAHVVAGDLRESLPGGLGREVLNYGHTFAHAVERVEGYSWRHGDAVSVGLCFIAALARRGGRLDEQTSGRHAAILGSLGLPTSYAPGRFAELHDAMRIDKKSRGAVLRLVVLDGVGRPGLLEGPDVALLDAAYADISEEQS